MSQCDDNVPFNAWYNYEFWNLNDCDRADLWSFDCKAATSNTLSKLNGFVPTVSSGYGECSDDPSLDSLSKLPSWAPIGSVLHDVDAPSIWATSELHTLNHHDLSLSGPSISWQSIISDDAICPNSRTKVWDGALESVSTAAVINVRPNSYSDEQLPKQREPPSSSGNIIPLSIHSCPFTDSGVSSLVSTKSHVTPCMASTSSSSSLAGIGSSKVTGRPADGPMTSAAFSTEQLCDHLINSNEGWGRRPIDQITSWEATDPSKSADSLRHSGFATPTPGSRATSGSTIVYRSLQSQQMESNIWTTEPPTGTGIWELHCESFNVRETTWNPTLTSLPANTSVCDLPSRGSGPLTLLNSIDSIVADRGSSHFHPPPNRSTGTNRLWDSNDIQVSLSGFWSGSNGTSAIGRPLLGGTRSGSTITPLNEMPGWCQDSPALSMGPIGGEGNFSPWENLEADTTTLQWSSSTSTGAPLLPSIILNGTDTLSQQQTSSNSNTSQSSRERMLVHPFSNTYRADLVRYLMSQGFRKEDVHAALIDCNMEPERALHELRERCHLDGCQYPGGNGTSQFQPPNSFTALGSQIPSNCVNSTAGPGLVTSIRGTFPVAPGTTSSTNQLISLGPQPNQQLIRQQITQQLRSALNLSLPNSLASNIASNQSSSVTSGNSLLGQPPPPLLCSNSMSPNTGLNLNMPGSTYLPHSKNTANSTPRFSSNFIPLPKRSDRQMSIIASIQELHRKHQSIQQQVNVYRNNPAMCSQPQYADVFAELQGQIQQIEAQLRAKQVQLNMAYAQDYVISARGQPLANITDRSQTGGNGTSSIGSAPHCRAVNQDQLVQQFMDLRVRSGTSTYTDTTDSDFPVVGTWTPYTKNNYESSDKPFDGSAPRPHTAARPVVSKVNQLSNLCGTWQPNGSRVTQYSNSHNWRTNGPSRPLDGGVLSNNLETCPVSNGVDPQLCKSTGQWLLIQPLNVSSLPLNFTILHHILSQFGLTHFRVLNATTGCVLIHLQSNEFAIQLIRSLGDRFSIEAISDPDLLAQVQQRTQNFTSHFNVTGDSGTALPGNGFGAHWIDPDHRASNKTIYGPKKPNAHTGHLGVMVSGIQ